MIGQIVKAIDNNGNKVEGIVLLPYLEAIASGTNEYVSVTEILIRDNNGNVITIRPRNIKTIHPYYPPVYPHNSAGIKI
jgi:hypothetical protein